MRSANGIIDGYKQLANAIVEQAAKDYKGTLRMLKKDPGNTSAMEMKVDCEMFFKSGWIMEITPINGVWLMEALAKVV